MNNQTKKIYPKILSNIPKGKDLFEASSHQNISNTIITLIENQSEIIEKQIIGLEGGWGTGKSNIVKIIEEDTKDKYLHFTYDTWTHQEDLTRKSILQELLYFLKLESVKVIDKDDESWIAKENQLSQKVVSKNITHLPKLKSFYVLTIIAFIIIKFGNEIYKQTINNRLYGFYDDSITYLIENFNLEYDQRTNWKYILKLFPFILLIIAFFCFIKALFFEIRQNNVKFKDERLPITQVIGKLFYWISGEKLESNSNETINEKEPSNQNFKRFLNDIDIELGNKGKKLIFNVDNTDRLSENKLKNIWSTINIFFAESNSFEFLKNIWLIIPYDEEKLVNALQDESEGLLEKTFSITFHVPPPLLSNWESFFDKCFMEAFNAVQIKNKAEELQLLKKIFQTSEEIISPRKIINFINQITTHNIQNSEIKLRYNAIFIVNKKKLTAGNVNENILNKKDYINGVTTIFIDDDQLEINISKIIYGLKSDKEAEEVIFVNVIDDILTGLVEINKDIINSPAFTTYFDKRFKRLINSHDSDKIKIDQLDLLTQILVKVRKPYIDKFYAPSYNGLWVNYSELILKNNFTSFDETHKSVIVYCKKSIAIKVINNTLENIQFGQTNNLLESSEYALLYLAFLDDLDNYLSENINLNLEDINVRKNNLPVSVFLNSLKDKNLNFVRYNLSVDETSFRNFFLDKNKGLNRSLIVSYREQIIHLKNHINIEFIINEINSNWTKSAFKCLEEVETVMMFHDRLEGELSIDIYNLDFPTFDSLINLLSDNSIRKTSIIASLLIMNFSESFALLTNNKFDDFLSQINNELVDEIKKYLFPRLPQSMFVKLLKVPVILGNPNLHLINQISESFLDINDVDYETYVWVFKNYNKILTYTFLKDEVLLSNFLNNNYTETFNFNFSEIDIDFIENSSGILKERIIMEINNHLQNTITNISALLVDTTSIEYRILRYVVNNGKVSESVLDKLQIIFPNLINFNYALTETHYSTIMKIKSYFSHDAINKMLEYRVKRIPRKGIVFFIPEVLSFLQKYPVLGQQSIMSVILEQNEFYTPELIDFIIGQGNQSWLNTLKLKVSNDNKIYDYAKEKKIL